MNDSQRRIVDRTHLPVPAMHDDIRREDRVKIFELILRGQGVAAYQLAADLEEARIQTERHRAREARLEAEYQRQREVLAYAQRCRQRALQERQQRRELRADALARRDDAA